MSYYAVFNVSTDIDPFYLKIGYVFKIHICLDL